MSVNLVRLGLLKWNVLKILSLLLLLSSLSNNSTSAIQTETLFLVMPKLKYQIIDLHGALIEPRSSLHFDYDQHLISCGSEGDMLNAIIAAIFTLLDQAESLLHACF